MGVRRLAFLGRLYLKGRNLLLNVGAPTRRAVYPFFPFALVFGNRGTQLECLRTLVTQEFVSRHRHSPAKSFASLPRTTAPRGKLGPCTCRTGSSAFSTSGRVMVCTLSAPMRVSTSRLTADINREGRNSVIPLLVPPVPQPHSRCNTPRGRFRVAPAVSVRVCRFTPPQGAISP
jgi:hypothetical protein